MVGSLLRACRTRPRQALCETPAMSVSLWMHSQTSSHSFCIRCESHQLSIITQLVVEHQVIGVLPSFVALGTELLQGFFMLFIPSLVIWQDAVGCVPGHLPHVDGFIGCGLGCSIVHCLKPGKCLELFS